MMTFRGRQTPTKLSKMFGRYFLKSTKTIPMQQFQVKHTIQMDRSVLDDKMFKAKLTFLVQICLRSVEILINAKVNVWIDSEIELCSNIILRMDCVSEAVDISNVCCLRFSLHRWTWTTHPKRSKSIHNNWSNRNVNIWIDFQKQHIQYDIFHEGQYSL